MENIDVVKETIPEEVIETMDSRFNADIPGKFIFKDNITKVTETIHMSKQYFDNALKIFSVSCLNLDFVAFSLLVKKA
jgi:hypothetical protein